MGRSILKLNRLWEPSAWISYEEAARLDFAGRILRHIEPVAERFSFAAGFAPGNGERRYWSVPSVVVVDDERRPRVMSYPSRDALFRRDHYMCLYCGARGRGVRLTRDHIRPRSRGGEDTWMNMVTACAPCNGFKGDREPEEAGMALLAVPYQPNPGELLYILRHRQCTGDQMAFLEHYFSPANRERLEYRPDGSRPGEPVAA